MSLTGAFQIGRSALTASQLAIQTTGNNVANATSPGYSRQTISTSPTRDVREGNSFVGLGVSVLGIRRQVDDALQQRLWTSVAAEGQANTSYSLLSNVETTIDGLGDASLSRQMDTFFSSWSTLADHPNVAGNRSLVVQSGRQIAAYVRDLRANLTGQRNQLDQNLAATVNRANDLLDQLASLNVQVVTAEGGQGMASSLRDQRDAIVTELAQYMDVTPIQQPNGGLDLMVGSTPVVLAGRSRGVELRLRSVNGKTEAAVVTKDNQEVLPITGGGVGAMLSQRGQLVDDAITRLDEIATYMIHEVNRIHSTGNSSTPLRSVTGTLGFVATDQALSLNDPANATMNLLPAGVRPKSGSFLVTVTNAITKSSQTVTINVDLDGINAGLTPGFANDTSLATLQAAVGSISNLTATLTPDGKLKIDAGTGYEVSFSEDTSGVLATLGINTFFTGSSAIDIGVRDAVAADPNLVNAGRVINGQPADNGAALAISQLRSKTISGLGNVSFAERWDQAVQSIAVRTNAARTNAGSTTLVRENLDAQRAAISGVSLDEEAVNLLAYQRQYQASARFITVIDELTQTLLAIGR